MTFLIFCCKKQYDIRFIEIRKCDGKNENKGVNEEIYGKDICEFKNMVQREEEEFVVLLKNRRNK